MDYALPTPWFSPRPFTSPWRDEARGDDRRRGRRRPDPMLMEADGPGPDERRGPRGGHGHGHGRGRGGFGPGMPPVGPGFDPFRGPRGGRRARRGDVRLAALLLIAEEPRNGYQLIQELQARSGGTWKPSPGAMYPALSQLEDEGLIRASETGKTYEITAAGRVEVEALKDRPAPWEPDQSDDATLALRHALHQVHRAVGAIAESGDDQLAARATAELDALKKKLFGLLAES